MSLQIIGIFLIGAIFGFIVGRTDNGVPKRKRYLHDTDERRTILRSLSHDALPNFPNPIPNPFNFWRAYQARKRWNQRGPWG